jgi:L-asparaginase
MKPAPYGLSPDLQFGDRLSHWLGARYPKMPFSLARIDPLIDSADVTPRHWAAIAREILDRHDGFKAVIVLHGTDTLAYTASALSFCLAGLGKPLILTGAQIPFSLPDSDAEANIAGAFACALEPRLKEVCIFFDGRLIRGNRAIKTSTSIGDSFASPHWPQLGRFGPTLAIDGNALLTPAPARPLPPVDRAPAISVGLLKVYPGFPGDMVLAAADLHRQGLVLELYGSGTAPMQSPAVVHALTALAVRKIPVIGVSQCRRGTVSGFRYASSRALADAGVIPGHDLTPEAALTKLSHLQAIGVPFGELAAAIARDLVGEVTAG